MVINLYCYFVYLILMVKKYTLRSLMTIEEVKSLEGEFLDMESFNLIIDHDADVYHIDEKGVPQILFYYRKNIIPRPELNQVVSVFKDEAIRASSIRGKASGVVDPSQLSSNIVGVVSPGNFKSRVIYNDGTVSKYYMSNKVNSLIAGYFDKPKISDKSQVIKSGAIPCRTTAFTENNWNDWTTVFPLVHRIDGLYQKLAPTKYKDQKHLADLTPNYQIDGTAFSTLTVNHSFRTAVHIDQGDFKHGLSAIIVASYGDYKGGYLGYPQYGVCVDLRSGDFILKDPHQYHCNTQIYPGTKASAVQGGKDNQDWSRLSIIFYYRENMQKCLTKTWGQKSSTKVKPSYKVQTQSGGDFLGGTSRVPLAQITRPYEIREVFPKKSAVTEAERLRPLKHPQELSLIVRPNTTDDKVIEEVITKDVYEKKSINFFIESDDVWLDLGGNIGTFTLMVLDRDAKVITFEPEPENYDLLKGNVELNFGLDSRQVLGLFPTAVGAKEGTVDLYLCKGDYNKYRHTVYKKRGRESISIKMESIKSVLQKFKEVTAIKMDIEGSEIDILETMKLEDWKRTQVKKLVFEYSFDIDPSIPRFLEIIKNLRKYFKMVHYTKVKENELEYRYFPAMTLVYCLC
jgi:FkbM family methyltransferase